MQSAERIFQAICMSIFGINSKSPNWPFTLAESSAVDLLLIEYESSVFLIHIFSNVFLMDILIFGCLETYTAGIHPRYQFENCYSRGSGSGSQSIHDGL